MKSVRTTPLRRLWRRLPRPIRVRLWRRLAARPAGYRVVPLVPGDQGDLERVLRRLAEMSLAAGSVGVAHLLANPG